MPGKIIPDDFITHELNPIKGWWFGHTLDKVAPLKDGGSVILSGRVCHLDVNGDVVLGLEDNQVGLLAFPNSTDFDVSADRGNIQKEVMLAIPTIGSFEVQTTEFDATKVYQIGDYLSALPAASGANAGLVTLGVPYVDTLVGHVTEGVKANENRKNILTFWTYHLPIAVGGGS